MYRLLGDTWITLVDNLGLEPGSTCVFTKDVGHSLWLDVFDENGTMITQGIFKGAATLRRVQLPLEWNEESKFINSSLLLFYCLRLLNTIPYSFWLLKYIGKMVLNKYLSFVAGDRMKHICYWPFHTDHFGERQRSFYKSYAMIQCYNRLVI